jgi:hypothetical protein
MLILAFLCLGSLSPKALAFDEAREADHSWDFRSCQNGMPVRDRKSSIKAHASMRASCSAEGISLDGVGDKIEIEPWSWGGKFSVELLFKFNVEAAFGSLIFHFTGAEDDNSADSLFLMTEDAGSSILQAKLSGFPPYELETQDLWKVQEWVHVVATFDRKGLVLYKDGPLFSSKTNDMKKIGIKVRALTLGEAPENEALNGVLSFIRVWHNEVLNEDQAKALYLKRHILPPSEPKNVLKKLLRIDTVDKPRFAVIMAGESARWRDSEGVSDMCSPNAVSHQIATTASQRYLIFENIQVRPMTKFDF